MTVVYVVVIGENYQGYNIEGIFSSMSSAQEFIQIYISGSPRKWIRSGIEDDSNSNLWISGCNYLQISEEIVND